MRRNTMLIFVVIVVSALSHKTSHSEGLSYSDALRSALNHSARIKVKREEIRIAEAEYRQQLATLYPEVSLNSRIERFGDLDYRDQQDMTTISNEVIGGNQDSWRSSAYVFGQYRLSNWYKKGYEVDYYGRLQTAKADECEAEAKNVCREMIELYAASSVSKIKLNYGYEIVTCLHHIYELKKLAKAKGEVAEEEIVKMEADLSRARTDAAAVRKELLENLARMALLTGCAYNEDTVIAPLEKEVASPSFEAMPDTGDSPEYKSRLIELEALRMKAKSAENAYWPDISIYARYDYYGSSPDSLDDAFHNLRSNSYTTGVLVSMPLVDGGLRIWRKRQSHAEIRRQEERLRAAGEENNHEVNRLQLGYGELLRSMEQYRTLLEQYEKLIRISRGAGELGERNNAEVMAVEKEKLVVERELRATEQMTAAYEKRLSLEKDYKGFVAALNDANTCLPCRSKFPEFIRLQDYFQGNP